LAFGAGGAGLLALLALGRALTTANDAYVTFAGRELHWTCAFKQAFGVPCPNCGMTRSVVFTLHGEWAGALRMNPAGPVLVIGALALCVALLAMALGRPRVGEPTAASRAARRLALASAVYGGVFAAVLLANWVRVIT
jgi:hypothetical protein